jgi:uncharacterized protein (TIGR03790 family)
MHMSALLLTFAACSPEGEPKSPGSRDDTAGVAPGDSGVPWTGAPTVTLPKLALAAADFAVVVNTDDPHSGAVATLWAEARGVPADRIVPLALGTADTLDRDTFAAARADLDAALSDDVQALTLAFTVPYRVDCMGASAAFALGFDEAYCSTPCSPTRAADTYASASTAPWTDHRIRPAMMLPTASLEEAEALVARGVAADDTRPAGDGWFVRTTDEARSVRYRDFEATVDGFDPAALSLAYRDNHDGSGSDLVSGESDVLFYLTGLTRVGELGTNTYLPGALADHLTSYGGVLSDSNGQMPVTEWISAGVTASYGTAHEPCNYPQKFPEASVLTSRYFRGATAIEAYWASVNWPGEGNFVGEPLARPFGPTVSWDDGLLEISTTHIDRDTTWVLEAAGDEDGPWDTVQADIGPGGVWGRVDVRVEDAWRRAYRLVPAP